MGYGALRAHPGGTGEWRRGLPNRGQALLAATAPLPLPDGCTQGATAGEGREGPGPLEAASSGGSTSRGSKRGEARAATAREADPRGARARNLDTAPGAAREESREGPSVVETLATLEDQPRSKARGLLDAMA
jgi:hypothetical protein